MISRLLYQLNSSVGLQTQTHHINITPKRRCTLLVCTTLTLSMHITRIQSLLYQWLCSFYVLIVCYTKSVYFCEPTVEFSIGKELHILIWSLPLFVESIFNDKIVIIFHILQPTLYKIKFKAIYALLETQPWFTKLYTLEPIFTHPPHSNKMCTMTLNNIKNEWIKK